ncbi:hypothetical protein NT239_13545 [Chitinibacter sp. SCUT-21]|uniref:hypothetical protein n=1 Tax=Chitinibacter sp. SCUT-21 TaxID=2970891 RepID=UPI0035A65F01
MKALRIFLFCVMAIVLPVNTVLAQSLAHAKILAASHSVAGNAEQTALDHSHHPQAESEQHLHLHKGLFGKVSVHIHEPAKQNDCIKACQAMPSSMLAADSFAEPLPLAAILVGISLVTPAGVTVDPLEDPPKLRA